LNLDILLQIWEWAEWKITTEEINNKMLIATDIAEMTAWLSEHCGANYSYYRKYGFELKSNNRGLK
jgi:hypothetical protein